MKDNMKFGCNLMLLASAAVATGVAADKPTMFPKEVIDAGEQSNFGDRLEEPPLWREEALTRYARRIQLMMGGHTKKSWSIRIDEKPDGSRSGRFVEGDYQGVISEAGFRVHGRDFAELQNLITKAKL